jgi:hypothetical protein
MELRRAATREKAIYCRFGRYLSVCFAAFLWFPQVVPAQTGYVGAEACGVCHPEEFATQSQSNHSRSLHPASDIKWLEQVPTGKGGESSDPKAAQFEFSRTEAQYQVKIVVGSNELVVPIQWIFDADDQDFTFFSRLDDRRLLEHRLSEDPIVTRFQPVGLQVSSCVRKSNGAITCTTCHNPHQNARRNSDAFYNSRCLSCHAFQSAKSCKVSPSEGCIRCHMPKVSPLPYLTFSDYWIRVHK